MLTMRFRYSVGTGLLCGLFVHTGCAGKVELVALTSAGGTSGAGGTSATNGAAAGLCTQPGCVRQDSGVGGAVGGAAAGGTWSSGNAPSSGGVPSIVPACPGFTIASSSPDASIPAQCASVAIDIEPIDTDLFIMLDRTQSMTYTLQGSALQRWDAIEQGFQKFTSYQSTRVGLNYFGKTGNPNDPAECDASSYAQAAVPIDYWSNNSTTLVQSVTAEGAILGGQTPWFPALQGGLLFSQKWALANLSHRTVLVFVTDGYPTECDTDITHVTSVVSDALQARGLFAGGPSIYTYVIGVAADKYNLDLVAKAGGTNQSTIVDGPAAPDQFATALQNIVSSVNSAALRCDWSLPTPPQGQALDPSMVQVIYEPYAGNNQEIPRADSAASCGGPNGGWYFNNPSYPTNITLCPCTCSNVAAGSVELRLGCHHGPTIN